MFNPPLETGEEIIVRQPDGNLLRGLVANVTPSILTEKPDRVAIVDFNRELEDEEAWAWFCTSTIVERPDIEWPFQNCTIDDLNRDNVEFFAVMDSPREDCVSLYYGKDDLRFPCRDVNYNVQRVRKPRRNHADCTTPRTHFNSVLRAWAKQLPLRDFRTDKKIPLPS